MNYEDVFSFDESVSLTDAAKAVVANPALYELLDEGEVVGTLIDAIADGKSAEEALEALRVAIAEAILARQDELADAALCTACHGSGGGRGENSCRFCGGTGSSVRREPYFDELDFLDY